MTDPRVALATLGWRTDTAARLDRAIRAYQAAWNLGTPLEVDGVVGEFTTAALEISLARKAAGKADLSKHFSAWEFACKCGGRYADCDRIWPSLTLVRAAETYRTLAGRFTPVSACRCPRHNKAVGGFSRSQHLHGVAMDVPAVYSVKRVKALGAFAALGINTSNKTVRHVDNRQLGPDNFPRISGSTSDPYRFFYG